VKSDEFVREVDEAVRRERWLALWQQYRAYILGTAIAVVVGTGAGVAWRQWQVSDRLAEARSFAAAEELLGQGQAAEAAGAFAELADESDTGFTVLARLRQAEALGEAGELGPKRQTLQALATSDEAAPTYRSLARLLEAQVDLGEGNPGAVDGLLARNDDPFRSSAKELEALGKLQQGEIEAARALLTELIDAPATPVSLRARARELRASLGDGSGEPAASGPRDDGSAASAP
jgi:hypothetical protein